MHKQAIRHRSSVSQDRSSDSQERTNWARPGAGLDVYAEEARRAPTGGAVADAPERSGETPARFDVPNVCMTLSMDEADIVLNVLNADRSAQLLEALQDQRDDEAAMPVSDRSYKVSELAILGHEIILTLRDQIESTREAGVASVDVSFVTLACGFVLRSGLCRSDSDDAVIANLLDRAASCPVRT